jgi:hypothetical protein
LSILSDVALLGTINVTYNTAFEVVLFLTNDGSSPTSTNACPVAHPDERLEARGRLWGPLPK